MSKIELFVIFLMILGMWSIWIDQRNFEERLNSTPEYILPSRKKDLCDLKPYYYPHFNPEDDGYYTEECP